MRTIYIYIGDFRIQIKFKKSSGLMFLQEKMIREITMLWRGYVYYQRPKRIDYVVEFQLIPHMKFFVHEHTATRFIGLYEQVNDNKIIVSYTISTSQFHFILRKILLYLLKDKGFIFHGAAVANNNDAFLFIGKSGSGKTTISSLLAPNFRSLNDDYTFIQKSGGTYCYYQTPLWERNGWYQKDNKQYKLKKIFFLKKASSCKIEKITDKEFLFKYLVSNLIEEEQYFKNKSKLVFKFVEYFDEFYMLSFTKDRQITTKFFTTLV
ncbi:MAG: hypothetical protein NUV98_04220 [Candidatus Roizmanbacteria bacterium]|nr:hypothetical protein [Candidatus Roizmanbacteria bacterium]